MQISDKYRRALKDGLCCRKHWEEKHQRHPVVIGEALCNPFGMPMMLCLECGNKRCPRATDCSLQCTNSNEPGQEGSIYG